jgi:hypothetical protein
MKEIKKGDIVARKSYNKDVFFEVNYISCIYYTMYNYCIDFNYYLQDNK